MMVLAHGFGIRYDLPVPLALYLVAAGAVVVLSFVLVAYFVRGREGELDYPRKVLSGPAWLGRLVDGPLPRALLGTVGVLALAAIVFFGLAGSPDATNNPAEYVLWIYFWAATVVLSGLVGDIYALANPFSALYDLAYRILHRPPGHGIAAYPRRLGVWPAVEGYFLFAFLELASGQAAHPRSVALVAIVYTAYTFAGMLVFGRDQWLAKGEFFSVLFRLVGAMGVVAVRHTAGGREVEVRPPAVGLAHVDLEGWDIVAFVILTLSSLAFDGVSATPAWGALYTAVLPSFDSLGAAGPIVIKGLGLVGLTLAFFAIYAGFIALVNRLAGAGRPSLVRTASTFAFTLVPIALVYNAAHNYSYIVIQGQGIIPLLADPLHNGWHLLPTGGYKPSFAPADAGFVWSLQVILIVLGHVIAVYLSHVRSLTLFPRAKAALRSQYPMLVLMVIYTVTSLVILSQKITETG
ncbi:MAG: hypothetical protein QOK05_871 [Chloroflexota bacterium]|jgi:hypothetical protein|nr:hypothetical protein [Chloroflexota bacterium]